MSQAGWWNSRWISKKAIELHIGLEWESHTWGIEIKWLYGVACLMDDKRCLECIYMNSHTHQWVIDRTSLLSMGEMGKHGHGGRCWVQTPISSSYGTSLKLRHKFLHIIGKWPKPVTIIYLSKWFYNSISASLEVEINSMKVNIPIRTISIGRRHVFWHTHRWLPAPITGIPHLPSLEV